MCSFLQCFPWSKNDVYCKQEYRIQGYINLLPLLPPPPLHCCCPALTAVPLLHPSPIQHCCPCPCHAPCHRHRCCCCTTRRCCCCTAHHRMVGCKRGRTLVIVGRHHDCRRWSSSVVGRHRLSLVVSHRRLSSSSVVVVDIVGGRSQWLLLSLPLLSLSLLVVGRSSWSAMVMTAIILLRVMGTARHRSHVSCELSMLLKKTKSTYLRRRHCRGAVLGG